MNAMQLQSYAELYARTRSDEALAAAVENCLPLCTRVARRFSGHGLEEEDLRQTAAMACVKALKSYAPERGVPFAAFAAQYAAGAVRNELRDHAGAIRLPRSLHEQTTQLSRMRSQLTQQLFREPTAQELSDALGWSLEKTLDTLLSREAQSTLSLDEGTSEVGFSLSEIIGGEDASLNNSEDRRTVEVLLSALPGHDRELIELRFLENLSQRDVARRLGMTQMQVHRSEKRLLGILRERLLPS